MRHLIQNPSIDADGWVLLSAEDRAATSPESFLIPSLTKRKAIAPGNAAKLLFEIEAKSSEEVVDHGVDRMWVIVQSRAENGYIGVLDSDPGEADGLSLSAGDLIAFRPCHVCDIGHPPHHYIIEKYGSAFFE